jgi:hypothetical protein
MVPKIGIKVNADNFSICNLTISQSNYDLDVSGNGIKIVNVTCSSILVRGSNCQILANTFRGQSVSEGGIGKYPPDISGSNNEISANAAVSINVEGDNNSITANKASSIRLNGCSNVFCDNSLSYSIILVECNSNIIYRNTCIMLELIGGQNNVITGNIMQGPGNWGILVGAGSENIFYANTITGFKDPNAAVTIGADGKVENNLFCYNNFIDNQQQVSACWEELGSGNLWDNGSCGNYWDSYHGGDADGDGIGDVPRTVTGTEFVNDQHVSHVFGVDHYPLMAPVDIVRASENYLKTHGILSTAEAASGDTKDLLASPTNSLLFCCFLIAGFCYLTGRFASLNKLKKWKNRSYIAQNKVRKIFSLFAIENIPWASSSVVSALC